MAGVTDMPKLLLLLFVVVGTCSAAKTCTFTEPATDCEKIVFAKNNRSTIVTGDNFRYKVKFDAPGIMAATLVVDPLPAGLEVKKISFSCQRKKGCKATTPCTSADGKIIATVKNARALDFKLALAGQSDTSMATATLYTSCGENIPISWGGPTINVPINGPQPVGAPTISVTPQTPQPTAAPTPEMPPIMAGGPISG